MVTLCLKANVSRTFTSDRRMTFSRTLNFTSANEDGASELAALSLGAADRVLCLTASGARPLDLLVGDPGSVIAIDVNPAQNALLALKIAAIRALATDDLYAYLGITPCNDRVGLHAEVERGLGEADRRFWRERKSVIRRGVWYAGRWERVLRAGAFGTQLVRRGAIRRLFDAPDTATQREVWRREFDDWIWRGAIRVLSQRWFWTHLVGEPGGAHLPDARTCEARLAGVFNRAAESILLRESDFAWLIMRGRHDASALPLHLRRENLDVVRARLDRIEIREADLAHLDRETLGQFDAFSLSDFGSYCGQTAYDACWSGVLRVANPGARYCERIFMNPLLPTVGGGRVQPDEALAARLATRDKAIIYDFHCGTIAG